MKKFTILLVVLAALSCKKKIDLPCDCTPPEQISFKTVASGTTEDLTDVNFSNAEGIIVGTYGFVSLTEDNGAHWSTVAKPTDQSLMAANHLGGGRFFGGRNNLHFSEDRGNTYQDYTGNLSEDNAIKSIYFINPQVGQIIKGNAVYRTTNAGSDWNASAFYPGYLRSFQFLTDNVGWMYGGITYDDVSIGELYKTMDGGISWTQVQHDFKDIIAATFYYDSTGYIATGDHKIWFTHDSGENWELISSDLPYTINSMIYRGVLVAATYEGKIVQLKNEDHTWKEIYQTPGATSLNKIYQAATGTIWVSGNNGVLLKSK